MYSLRCFLYEVVIPFEDIGKIQTSEHFLINPAIAIVLRPGAGGRGVPPLKSRDDDDGGLCHNVSAATYMFASFGNRDRVLKDLQRAQKNFNEILEVEKENAVPELCAHNSSVRGSKILDKAPVVKHAKNRKASTYYPRNEVIPGVAELFSNLFIDGPNFTGKNN